MDLATARVRPPRRLRRPRGPRRQAIRPGWFDDLRGAALAHELEFSQQNGHHLLQAYVRGEGNSSVLMCRRCGGYAWRTAKDLLMPCPGLVGGAPAAHSRAMPMRPQRNGAHSQTGC